MSIAFSSPMPRFMIMLARYYISFMIGYRVEISYTDSNRRGIPRQVERDAITRFQSKG